MYPGEDELQSLAEGLFWALDGRSGEAAGAHASTLNFGCSVRFRERIRTRERALSGGAVDQKWWQLKSRT